MDPQIRRRKTIAKGLYLDQDGLAATVKVHGGEGERRTSGGRRLKRKAGRHEATTNGLANP